jgi:MFS family permease
VIVLSQFAGGSLWFSVNAALPDLARLLGRIDNETTGQLTAAVQAGFITGTFLFALLMISDRFSPRKVFFVCALCGALSNLLLLPAVTALEWMVATRLLTGFFLAGIYPVGMRIAAGWFEGGLGKALGFLIGALVLGTAFPHLLAAAGITIGWYALVVATSLVAASGGLLMLAFVPDGPCLGAGTPFSFSTLPRLWQHQALRRAAGGYFGHMWELYAFWAFLPLYLTAYTARHEMEAVSIPLWTFAIIGAGSIGCIAGGLAGIRQGNARVAVFQLTISGLCCLASPLLLGLPPLLFFSVLLLWGITVAGDSPQFSTLVARLAPQDLVGTALTLVNCIGFAITIVSILAAGRLVNHLPVLGFLLLAPGPLLGIAALWPLLETAAASGDPGR